MGFAAALVVCYLLGSIPTAYLLVRVTKGVDIRTVGSGNVGATNAMRAAGRAVGAVVYLADLGKGVLAAGVVPRWLLGVPAPGVALACGVAAVLGHDFPCFLRFRGGKGVATTMGVLLGSMPLVAGLTIGVWVAVFALCRYVSVASLAAAIVIPFSQLGLHRTHAEVVFGAVLALLVLVRHRSNLQRLLSGTEHRAGSRSS